MPPTPTTTLKGGTQRFISWLVKHTQRHPNMYEAVELFKAEQTATQVSLMQLAARELPVRRRRRQLTIKERYEAGNYTLSKFLLTQHSSSPVTQHGRAK